MTTSPAQRHKPRIINDLGADSCRPSACARAIPIDSAASLAYLNRNRTPHASASVCAPGGSFFALNLGEAGFQ